MLTTELADRFNILTTYLSKTHFNIILSPQYRTSRYPSIFYFYHLNSTFIPTQRTSKIVTISLTRKISSNLHGYESDKNMINKEFCSGLLRTMLILKLFLQVPIKYTFISTFDVYFINMQGKEHMKFIVSYPLRKQGKFSIKAQNYRCPKPFCHVLIRR
jgi:hypothetical protein